MNAVASPAAQSVRFEVRATEGVVIDHQTGLMWSIEDVGDGRIPWKEADAAAKAVRLGGFEDWRLPTTPELLSLVDYDRCDPAIDTDAFPTCKAGAYWTGTAWRPSPASHAWFVDFHLGYSNGSYRDSYARVRAVRSVSSAGQ